MESSIDSSEDDEITDFEKLQLPPPKQAHKNRKICLSGCRYDVVLRVAMECGFKIVPDYEMWDISWSDAPLAPEKVMEMRRVQNLAICGGNSSSSMQKMNHFPGMYEICRKDRLGRNLNRYKRVFSEEYDFFPMTWDLPSDLPILMDYWKRNRSSTFIIKPESGCQGKGIFLIRNLKIMCPFAKCVCQQYISQPFLIDGYKYDQRIYVLITCVDPLRVYVYNEGIARLATVKYSMPSDKNLDVVFMHLTNYSLNKFSESYDPQGDGSKRKLSAVYLWMINHGYEVEKLLEDIDEIIIKTILCAIPTLKHNYRTAFPKSERGSSCFELLGFDVLVDRFLKPMLLEVNHSPSFNLDLQVDNEVKTQLLQDVMAMLYFGKRNKSNFREQYTMNHHRRPQTQNSSEIPQVLQDQFSHELKNMGNFRLVFSEENPGKYSRFLDKEYCFSDIEEESFVKKPEPVISSMTISDDYWPQEYLAQSSLKLTSTGQRYVETKPPTPDELDPHEFMKFKYNFDSTPPRKFQQSVGKSKDKKRSKCRNNITYQTSQESMRPKLDGNANPREPEEEYEHKVLDKVLRLGPTSPPGIEFLSPSQRVKAALEKLKWKNVQKFQFVTKLNDEILRSRPCSALMEDRKMSASYSSMNLPPIPKATSPNSKKCLSGDNVHILASKSPYLADLKMLELDGSKLPSIMQQFATGYIPKRDETQVETKPQETSTNYVQEWINKGSDNSGKPKKSQFVPNNVCSEWLQPSEDAAPNKGSKSKKSSNLVKEKKSEPTKYFVQGGMTQSSQTRSKLKVRNDFPAPPPLP